MYTFIKSLPARRLLSEQLPSLCGSLAIAEIFYKFHSFLLEAIAFLATWYALDLVMQLLRNALAMGHDQPSSKQQ